VTFPSGVLGATQFQAINITIAGDTIPEGTGNGRSPQGETFTVTLSGPELVKPIRHGDDLRQRPAVHPSLRPLDRHRRGQPTAHLAHAERWSAQRGR